MNTNEPAEPLGHFKDLDKTGHEAFIEGSTHPVTYGSGAHDEHQAYLDLLLGAADDGIHRDYEREVVFSEEHEDSETYQRLVKDIHTSTYPDDRIEVLEFLAIERMRPQVGGGHYVRERTAVPLPASKVARAQLLLTLGAVLGLDVRVD